MENAIQKFEQKIGSIKEEIKVKDFAGKSESGMLDDFVTDKAMVKIFLEEKTEELTSLKNELLQDFHGDKSKLESELDKRVQNFLYEVPFLLIGGTF